MQPSWGRDRASRTLLVPLMIQALVCAVAMMSFTSLIGPVGRAIGLAPWQMGIAVTTGGIAWIAAAGFWGRTSDRRGRRPTLLAGLGGFSLCYAALCLFVVAALAGWMSATAAFLGLILWRGLAGAFYAAIPTASAALVADHLPPDRRAGAMGTLGMAAGAGMVLGPALAALTAPHGLALPFLAGMGLPALALAVLWRTLPREETTRPAEPPPPPRLGDPRLRPAVLEAFVGMFTVSAVQVVVGFFAVDRLGLSPEDGGRTAGLALTCVGVALTLSQASVRRLPWSPHVLVRLGASAAGLGFLAAGFASSSVLLCVCHFVAALGMGLVWPSVSALAANAVEAGEQGAAAGTVTAAQGLGTVLGPLVGTLVYSLDFAAPYGLAGVMLGGLALGLGAEAKKNG